MELLRPPSGCWWSGPLHVREIAGRAAEEGLIETPVYAVDTVYTGLRRAIAEAGTGSPVVETPPGTFTLREWQPVADEALRTSARITVELEQGGEPLSTRPEREPQAIWSHVAALVREEPALPLYARAHAYLRGLLAWGVLNVLGGLALVFRPRSSLAAGLSSALLDWGASQAALALVGLDQVRARTATPPRDPDEPPSPSAAPVRRPVRWGGGAWRRRGLVFGLLASAAPRARGHLTQGSFW